MMSINPYCIIVPTLSSLLYHKGLWFQVFRQLEPIRETLSEAPRKPHRKDQINGDIVCSTMFYYTYIYMQIYTCSILYMCILYICMIICMYIHVIYIYIYYTIIYIYIYYIYTYAVDDRTMGYVTNRVSLSFYGVLSVISGYTVPIWPWYTESQKHPPTR